MIFVIIKWIWCYSQIKHKGEKMDDLMLVSTFLYRHQADHAKGLLEDQGIESMVSADDCGGIRPNLSFGTGGVRIFVNKEDYKKAKEILSVLEEE